MKTKALALAAVLLLFSVSTAQADGVLRTPNGDMIVFGEQPCTNAEVLVNIKPEYHSFFKQAGVKFQGRLIHACWAVSPEQPDVVHLMDAEGDSAALPRAAIIFDKEV